jgi:hypothetical protein
MRLAQQVQEEYEAYAKVPFLIPRYLSYLFDIRHSLADTLAMNRDSLQGWLRSITEAKLLQEVSQRTTQNTIDTYFVTRLGPDDCHAKSSISRGVLEDPP